MELIERALAELDQLGIPVTRDDPTTSDVPLSIKMEGGSGREFLTVIYMHLPELTMIRIILR